MALSNELISQFAKITTEKEETKTEEVVYGTTVSYNGTVYVKLDGSDRLTPITSTTVVKPDERVTVMIKDHSAIVTGNLSSPSARNSDVEELGTQISEFDTIIANKVDTEELNATNARIDTLNTDTVNIRKDLNAANANIETLTADNVTINETLNAQSASIDNLEANKLSVEIADAKYATIENLEATNVSVNNLSSTYADFKNTTTTKLAAVDASIENLETNKLSAASADLKYANIDFSNIGQAAIEEFYAKSGIIKDLTIEGGTITGELVGVTIKGDLIEGGTVVADKLVVKGENGLYYKLNTDGVTTETQQTEYNSLNGSVITAKSIAATKISVTDLVAFDATIGGFKITENSIYSGAKESASNTTRGIYLDNDGQAVFGDDSNYLKYYKDTDNTYKLAISASSIYLSASNKDVGTMVTEANANAAAAKESVDNLQIGGRNLIKKSNVEYKSSEYKIVTYKPTSYLVAGETYTLSLCVTPAENVTKLIPYVSGAYTPLVTLVPNGTTKQIISGTFTASYYDGRTPEDNAAYGNIDIFRLPNDGTVTGETTIHWIKVEKGNKPTDWTPAPEDIDNKIDSTADDLELSIASQTASITNDVHGIVLNALEDYVEKDEYNTYKSSTKSQLEVLSDQIEMNFTSTNSSIETVDGKVDTKFEELTKYIRFSTDGIEIGKDENSLKLKLDNNMIQFTKNGTPIGWWDGNDFHTGNIVVEVNERAQFGNFAFTPRSDGSLTLLKVKEA
jgi:hypothetical protein